MRIFVFGSSLTSTFWNGAATYYRGLYWNLNALGYRITFAEPAIYGRQDHQDSADINYADVIVYKSPDDISDLLKKAARADVVIKHSGVGDEDERLENEVLRCKSDRTRVLFWDVDAPATLSRIEESTGDPFRNLIPQYDAIFTYGGGPHILAQYARLGARSCVPVYNALDSATHFPEAPDPELTCDLAFIGHRLPDREARVDKFFFQAAKSAPEMSFILGGEGWHGKTLPNNVRWIGHVPSDRHNAVNSSARMVLNVNRDSMATVGFSPPTRIFEAAGAGACVITDFWEGIERFFCPGAEILTAQSGTEVAEHLRRISPNEAAKIGNSMLQRAMREHTYESRAWQVHNALQALLSPSQSEISLVRHSTRDAITSMLRRVV
jgi:spore maturation protein CgeB